MSKYTKFAALLIAATLLTFMPGCSKNVKVTGTVSYEDGSPVQNGQIYLEGTVMGRADVKEGKFSLGLKKDGEGIPKGTYNVQCSKALPQLKADPSIEAYELIEPTQVTIDGTTQLDVKVRKLTADGPAPGEVFNKAWDDGTGSEEKTE